MFELILAATIYYGLCIGLTWLSRQDNRIIDHGGFHWASAFALLGSGYYLTLASVHLGVGAWTALFALFLLVPGAILLIPWWSFVVGHHYESAHKWLTGVESMKVCRSFDEAERAMKEKRFDDAATLFLAETKTEPANPDPWRRAGECRLAAGRGAEAVDLMNEGLTRTTSAEDRGALAFRIAEIQQHTMGDLAGAARTLKAAEENLKGTRFAEMARGRLERLSPSASAEAPHLF